VNCVTEGSFESVPELIATIEGANFISKRNASPRQTRRSSTDYALFISSRRTYGRSSIWNKGRYFRDRRTVKVLVADQHT
jgi:hypothetical protein